MNLLNGADLVPTLMQICYAVALGYLFVIIFIKSKSLVPCIATHILINALSIFNDGSKVLSYIRAAFLIIVSVGYALYINKRVEE